MSTDGSARRSALLLDLDGTLVDSVVHHTLAWSQALVDTGHNVPMWRIQPLVGMGGPQLLDALIGRGDEDAEAAHDEHFQRLRPQVRPLPGAADLLIRARSSGVRCYLVTSSKPADAEYLLGLLEGASVDGIVSSEDADRTKPHPDLFEAALERWDLAAEESMAVGDSEWDIRAAGQAGVRSVGLLSGGTPADRLLAAGAEAVFQSCQRLAEAPLVGVSSTSSRPAR